MDQQAWDEMVESYLPLVRSVAEKVHRRLPPGVDLTSLIHSGIVGLLEALGRFDPERGVAFEVYARYRIEGEVMQCLRSLDWASRSVRAWGRKVEAARNRLAGQLSRTPSVEEMAGELNVPLDEYYRIEHKVSEAGLLSLAEGRVCQIYGQAVGHLRELFGEKKDGKKKAAADAPAKPRVKKTVA